MSDQPQTAANRLRELTDLHDEGMLTDDEFAQMRAPLMTELGATGRSEVDQPPEDDPNPAKPIENARHPVVEELEPIEDAPKPAEENWYQGWFEFSFWQSVLILVGAVVVIALIYVVPNFNTLYEKVEYWAFPERAAYDAGVELFEGNDRPSVDRYLSCAYLRDAHESASSSEQDEWLNNANESLLNEARTSRYQSYRWSPEEDAFFVSGFWDEATRTCRDAFAEPWIAGRP